MTVLEGSTNYTLEKELGSGSYGITYLAKGDDGETYAIKKFKKEGHLDLQVEQTALSTITSICKDYATCFVESIKEGKDTYMVMDFIEGVDLAEIIYGPKGKDMRDHKGKLIKLEQRKRVNIIDNLVRGLKMLHVFGLIHQDIKAENLMFTNGSIKFIDFGLSCIQSKGEDIGYPVFGLKINYPCGTAGALFSTSPEMFHWDTQKIRYQNFKPMSDFGIYPLSWLLAHDVWSLCCVIMAWYTLKDEQSESFGAYALTLNDANFADTFKQLEIENPERYKIIVSLFDRDPISRLENFDSLNDNIVPDTEPNWNKPEVTLEQREYLRNWRCKGKKISDLDFGEDCETPIPISKPTVTVDVTLDDY